MKIQLIMNVRFPTEKAHGWQIAKMTEALVAQGHEALLVVPDRVNAVQADAKTFYGLRRDLPIVRLPVIDFLSRAWVPQRIAFFLMEWSFIRAVRAWARRQSADSAVVFTRDHFLAARFSRAGWKLALELHDLPSNFFARHRALASRVDLFVMTNAWKRDEAIRVWGADVKEKIVVLPNAIDMEPYRDLPSREEARATLGWETGLRYSVYTGHFYDWKGAYVLADASRHVPSDHRIVLVGGTKKDFAAMQDYVRTHALDHVVLIPHVPQSQVGTYLAAADCLVLPNSGKSWQSRYTTSPIKLWEYLAARRPVIASDLPAIRELVSDTHVRFVAPDDATALARGIVDACRGDESRVEAGYALAAANDWKTRADRLVNAAQTV